jgi:hypothetical protein
VTVGGVLAPGEDAPRPLREFPDGFAAEEELRAAAGWGTWLALGAALLAAGAGAYLWRRRRSGRAVPRSASVLERLAALERESASGASSAGCYELTRLLRTAGDELCRKSRGGLTDEEWLAEVAATFAVPRAALGDLTAAFERAARVKYAGEAPTPWAMQETFQRARAALAVLAPDAPAPGGTEA